VSRALIRWLLAGVALLSAIALVALALSVLSREGVTLGSLVLVAVSLFVALLLVVGFVGALRKPPPPPPPA
jgi:lipopolysaccharide export LptBFGC system permease protein LptF